MFMIHEALQSDQQIYAINLEITKYFDKKSTQ